MFIPNTFSMIKPAHGFLTSHTTILLPLLEYENMLITWPNFSLLLKLTKKQRKRKSIELLKP